MSKYLQYDYVIPEAYACYFADGDASGLDDSDIAAITKFENRLIKVFGHANIAIDPEADLGFRHYNDINNLGANCYTGTLLVERKYKEIT